MEDYSKLEVFLVEPSITQQHIICNYLNELGIEDIICCTSGAEVFTQFMSYDPDLVISAMYLPDMTGSDLVVKLRDEEYEIAFMLISSETNLKRLEPIKQAGAVAILVKPFTLEALKVSLNTTIHYLKPERVALEYLEPEDVSILLVDDSRLALRYITKILNDMGVENITQVTNGHEAIEVLGECLFDLVVTDYNMPGINGLELTKYIRDESEQKSTPIIMITSEVNEGCLAAMQQAGTSAILGKPFDADEMRNLIANLLN